MKTKQQYIKKFTHHSFLSVHLMKLILTRLCAGGTVSAQISTRALNLAAK